MELPHPRTGKLFGSPVPPGAGWPGDPATPGTPVAAGPADVAALAAAAQCVHDVEAAVSVCRACPRLVRWREDVAGTKRRSFAGQPYWGRPIPGWGAPHPGVFIVGLAPAAHGGNRTGRIFTGDRSGDFLVAGLHRAGLASQQVCTDAADGLALIGTRMAAAVRCAPPANKPDPAERATCEPWLAAEWRLVKDDVKVVVALGAIAWRAAAQMLGVARVPTFGHGLAVELAGVTLLGCYHPSQQNTFTGRLTPAMLDAVLLDAKARAGL